MAILLNTTDIHLTTAAVNFTNRASPLSMVCWVNSPNWGVSTASIVGVYLSGTTGIQIGTQGTSNAIDIWTWGGGNTISSAGIYTPVINTWIHIGYTWDGTNHRLYVNGALIQTSTAAVVSGILNQVYINGYPTGGTNECSNSLVDDVGFYGRALSAAEMSTIASARGYRDGIYANMFARYRFNELPVGTACSSVLDYSGNSPANPLVVAGAGTSPSYAVGTIDLDTRPVLG